MGYTGQKTIHVRGGQFYWRGSEGNIETINNGFALLTYKNLFGEKAETRFTVRFGLQGTHKYHIAGNHLEVNSDQFLVMNEATQYDVEAKDNQDVSFLAFCLNGGFVKDFVHYHSNNTAGLINKEGAYELKDGLPEFPAHTFRVNGNVKPFVNNLIQNQLPLSYDELDQFELFNQVLTVVFKECNQNLADAGLNNIVKQSTRVELFKRLCISKDYMETHFGEEINLNELSKVACLSPFHFHRAFKQVFGITPKKYVTQLRIQRAKELLAKNHKSVQMVCHAVGFKDVSSFTRLFTKNVGFSPSAYRKNQASVIHTLN